MNRPAALLAALGVVLLLVVFYLFLWKPKADEIARIEGEIEATITQQATTQARIRQLEEVRANAPGLEAALARTESIVPSDAGLPGAVRQLQLAADDSGVTLVAIEPGKPQVADEQIAGLARIDMSVQITGGYYQVVDFLRRVEDPSLTPRGLAWGRASVGYEESTYPELAVSLAGSMFAHMSVDGTPAPAQPAAPEAGEPGTDTQPEVEG